MNRRIFVKNAAAFAACSSIGINALTAPKYTNVKSIRITGTDSNFEREPLVRPFGFKGGFLTECWQVASRLVSEAGNSAIGLATQNVLYGDADLFIRHSEAGGNALLYSVTDKVLQLIRNTSFTSPVQLLDQIFPDVMTAAKSITGMETVNKNFVLNALISIDNAAWLLYAKENKLSSFDAMVPEPYRKALSYRNEKVAVMLQVPYGLPVEEVVAAVKQGYFVIKFKTGAPGSQSEMLAKDMERLSQVHEAVKDLRTDQTANGKLIYTMDANARYEKKETLLKYLDHARKIGAFSQILVIEEPLNEKNEEHMGDVGVRIAADESVHNEENALRRLELGYQGLVLKGVAKTLSNSMKIAALAEQKGVPCLTADLTVNPILIDWNKNLAARLKPFPGLGMGMLETNGNLNYKNWNNMVAYNPTGNAAWTKVRKGVFELDAEYFEKSGGIMETSTHYREMFK